MSGKKVLINQAYNTNNLKKMLLDLLRPLRPINRLQNFICNKFIYKEKKSN
jgi:hypothetical protein